MTVPTSFIPSPIGSAQTSFVLVYSSLQIWTSDERRGNLPSTGKCQFLLWFETSLLNFRPGPGGIVGLRTSLSTWYFEVGQCVR